MPDALHCSMRAFAQLDRVGLKKDFLCRSTVRLARQRVEGRHDLVCGEVKHAVVAHQDDPLALRSKQPGAAIQNLVEHRLRIRHRATDDLQHLGSGGLLLQRLGDVPIARLELLEHLRVPDRDHRLVGEGLEQLDVTRGERARLAPRHADQADGHLMTQQRNHQLAAPAALARHVANPPRHAGLGFRVRDLGDAALAHRHVDRTVGERPRIRRSKQVVALRIGRRERHEVQRVVDETKDGGRKAAEEAIRARRDGVEHRLHVRRRAGDDLEDVGGGGLALQRLLRLVEQPDVLERHAHAGGDGLEQAHLGRAEGAFALEALQRDDAQQPRGGEKRDHGGRQALVGALDALQAEGRHLGRVVRHHRAACSERLVHRPVAVGTRRRDPHPLAVLVRVRRLDEALRVGPDDVD
ncbi:MAG TPA: hypothetical protein VII31_00555, partial [Caldimonas sp.]